LGRHTPPETFFSLPVAVLEVFMWKYPQLVCHNLLDVVHTFKMTMLEVEFEFRKRKKSHGIRSSKYGGFGTT
jgi:hypothetical protein